MTQALLTLRTLVAGAVLSAAAALTLVACESASSVDTEELVGADDSGGEELSGTVAVGAEVRTIADVNLRSAPSTSGAIYRVIPTNTLVEVVKGSPTSGFYQVKHNGKIGWVSGKYITLVDEGSGDGDQDTPTNNDTSSAPASGKAGAIARAKSAVGFSYWWGHGRWRPEGATSSTRGSCSGSCGACSHKGSYGSDCSGFIAKVWQVPSSNDDVTVDLHPYSTSDFYNSTGAWSVINRSSIKQADGLVYRSGSKGHVMVYSSGDGWGSFNAYECKNCAAGCVSNLRKVGNEYRTIRRKGW